VGDFTLQLYVFVGRISGYSLDEHVEAVESGGWKSSERRVRSPSPSHRKVGLLLPWIRVEDLHHHKRLSNSTPEREKLILMLAISAELFVDICR
jgi:hypothetical protein